MASNIRQTLLKNLFTSKNINVKELKENMDTVFPSQELFIRFLSINNSQEIRQLANKITEVSI